MLRRSVLLASALLFAVAPGCSSTQEAGGGDPVTSSFGTEPGLDPDGGFFDFPWPSDLRLTAKGTPDVARFPDPGTAILAGLKTGAGDRKGFPVVPVGYFRFTKKPLERVPEAIVTDRALLLVDVDPASPERGKSFPIVAQTPNPDAYVPENLLAIAPRPGIVLAPHRKYAFVVTRAQPFESGVPTAPEALTAMAKGETPKGPRGQEMRDLYAPLWETLDRVAVPRGDVIAATVFTTGDVVRDNAALGDLVLARHAPDLTDFTFEPDEANAWPSMCHVRAKISLPQFQRGKPIFDTEGLFEFGPDGAPIKQRDESVSVSIAIPRQPMPAAGYPLIQYFHGSGGVAREMVDGDEPADGSRWPGPLVAERGFAMAGASLPISPERVPGAGAIDYFNINNVIALRDTFRQGVLESRLVLSALLRARIPASALEGCAGASLPEGETAYRFDSAHVHAQGQSMGGMYANLVSASEPRIQLVVPTGAGGFWVYFITQTKKIPGAAGVFAMVLGTSEKITFLHPALALAETALEPIDPMVSMPRLGKRPLQGHPARPVYQPVGQGDSYFPTTIYDAMTLAYGHPRAGEEVWPEMRGAQSLEGIDTPLSYPVKANLRSTDGRPYTGVVVQSAGDGVHDAHGIYRRIEGIGHQFQCFHATFRDTGTAVVLAPASFSTPCE